MSVSRLTGLVRRIAPVATLVAVCMLAATIAATLALLGSGSAVLEANVDSRVPVDYSADQVALKIPRLSPEIIDAARRDHGRSSGYAGTSGAPSTPGSGVPTANPSSGAAATPTPRPTVTPAPTPTLAAPTLTLPPVATLPPTPTLPPLPTFGTTPTVPLPGLPPTPTLPPLPPLP